MDSNKKHLNPSPEIKANILSRLFFCWVLPFLTYGYKKDLEVKDIYNTTNSDLSGPLGDKLEENWKYEVDRARSNKQKPSLKRAIFKTFWRSYAVYGFYFFIQIIFLRSFQPIVLSEFIAFFKTTEVQNYNFGLWTVGKRTYGYLLAMASIVLAFLIMLIYHQTSLGCQRVGMRVRIACCSLIYRKILKLSQCSIGQTASGQVVNLMSNDVQRFDTASLYLHYIWVIPIMYASAFYIMYNIIGVAALVPMLAMIIQSVPLQGYLSRVQGVLRFKIALRTDHRVKLMSEIVSGIQVIKMYGWEKPFEKLVELSRKLEIKFISKTSYIRAISLALMVYTERFVLYMTLLAYVFIGHQLTSDVVFSMSQFINIIQLYTCIMFPFALSYYAEAKVTLKRIRDFLILEENPIHVTNRQITAGDEAGLVTAVKASASWLPNPVVRTLTDLNFRIESGTLCCVVGDVGSGKSSLLQMLLRELPLVAGTLETKGRISYASQEPWLFVSSVRNNILFGQPYVKNRYNDVVKVCALARDFKQFLHGDKTLVGERGVSLSGGQRARINLARAVYVDADIYLFDDPLSAVDTHVGKHLFEQCIKGYLEKTTRILATHQLQFLKQADMIIVLKNGRIESIGSYQDLPEDLLKNMKTESEEESKEKHEIEHSQLLERSMTVPSIASSMAELDNEDQQETQELIEKGSLSASLYVEYYKNGASICMLLFTAFLFILAQVASNGCDLWVTHWTNEEENKFNNTNRIVFKRDKGTDMLQPVHNSTFREGNFEPIELLPSQEYYIIVYSIFIAVSILLTNMRSIMFFKVCMNACKGLHNKMFSNVLKAPMRFFDTNPSGRILNRFSKDIGAMDEILPKASLEAVQVLLVMAGILGMVFIVSYWMILVSVILGVLFYYFRIVYLASAQDIKRIEGITKAPIFSHVSATLYGISTIRSSGAEEMIVQEFDTLQDQHTGCWFLFLACSGAFGFYLDCISTAFLFVLTFQFLILDTGANATGNIGLAISSSMILIGMLQLGVRQTTEVTSNMTSVERVMQYTRMQKEEELNVAANTKPSNWPSAGKIIFKNTYLRYCIDDPPVLKNLSMIIKPGEKVGIVGRTGAGKSTLIASLFRLAPIEGTIAIDDVDTSIVDLEYLRSNISIIPQEPILFSASIRYNLDPFNSADDDVIWKALADVELKGAIDSLAQMVSEGGSNFSAGQRQLICLARAIIRNNKVLVMDEATANVDPTTDSLIQKTIRDNFKDCTVLTIAHRLNTIMDCDKVLVMDRGEAVEFAPPHELLQIPEGYFTKMVEQTGSVMEGHLRKIADDAYFKKVL
ncbi:unnamed protein product [Phaedon cochleariae]|uniref:Uncharacterized protein n=1 Tax=Phaedon cochleariae TaxID=80249 RepID=A0A9P0DRT8_PHACE|nr:unnamed protein product [Phaedon cochleariae]